MGYVQARRRLSGQYRNEQVDEMTMSKSILKIFKNEGYRIFAIAIFASFLWHIFWMSTITIVSRPDNLRPVKFSKVSFLGPLLGKGAMELRIAPKEHSFLEKRYISEANRLALQSGGLVPSAFGTGKSDSDAYHLRNDGMTASIDNALGGEKFEPSYEE